MEARVILPIEELTEEAFAPFGKVIRQPARSPDALGPGWTWWGENLTLVGGDPTYAVGYLDLIPSELTFNWAERHMDSDELLIPAGGDCLVYAGPPDFPETPGRLPDLDRFRVFRVRQGQGVLLSKGVWHGAPLAIDCPLNVIVLFRQGTGANDAWVVRFEDNPVSIDHGEE